jgi:hypothetical protein
MAPHSYGVIAAAVIVLSVNKHRRYVLRRQICATNIFSTETRGLLRVIEDRRLLKTASAARMASLAVYRPP